MYVPEIASDRPSPADREDSPHAAKRFLLLCTTYPTVPGDTFSTSELASALQDQGHHVDVLHMNWWETELGRPARRYTSEHGINVIDVAPRAITGLGRVIAKASKFLMTSRAATRAMGEHLAVGSYDAVIAWSPALTVAGPLRAAIAAGVRYRLLFIYDFFPIHHREIGLVPSGPPFWIAKALESHYFRKFTTIICNMAGNARYLRANYRLREDQEVVVNPLWCEPDPPPVEPRDTVRQRYGLPTDRPIAIFGGQLSEGRGLEQMLEAARCAEAAGSPVVFLFVGSGRLEGVVKDAATRSTNVIHRDFVARLPYLSLIAACDVGLVATVEGVSSFAYPTKTMDYLRAGIPIVAAVEPGSDYIDLLREHGIGRAVPFGDAAAFFAAIDATIAMTHDQGAFREVADRCLDEVFHPRHVLETVHAATPVPTNTSRHSTINKEKLA